MGTILLINALLLSMWGSGSCTTYCPAGTYDTMCTDDPNFMLSSHSSAPTCNNFPGQNCQNYEADYPGVCEKCCQTCRSSSFTTCPHRLNRNCQNCAAGKYTQLRDEGVCNDCPANSYSPAASSALVACTCNAGFSGMNGGTCTQCAAGKYKNSTGSAACQNCTAGQYSPVGSALCMNCSAGQYSSAGSINCTACRAGTYNTGSGTCIDCAQGTYSAAIGATSCMACPGNSSAPAGSSSFSACVCNINYQGMVA